MLLYNHQREKEISQRYLTKKAKVTDAGLD